MFSAVPVDPQPRPGPQPIQNGVPFGARLNAQLVRRPGRLVAACLATVLGPAVVAQATSMTVQATPAVGQLVDPSDTPAPAPAPGDQATWLPVARQAASTCPGLPSSVLVAIGHVESGLGLQTWTSAAGAMGPMQFLPTTWAAYGADGDGDGVRDVMNPVDAVYGAARLLCANGGGDPERLASAVWNYNHSDDYVRHVIALSRLTPL